MKLKINEENGGLTVSVLSLRKELIISEEEGGFVFEIRERAGKPAVASVPVKAVPPAAAVAVPAEETPFLPPVCPAPVLMPAKKAPEVGTSGIMLFQKLAALRREIANENEKKVPPYVIFHDKTLWEMVEKLPENIEAFRNIEGVGQAKLEKYGARFLAVIHHHLGVVAV